MHAQRNGMLNPFPIIPTRKTHEHINLVLRLLPMNHLKLTVQPLCIEMGLRLGRARLSFVERRNVYVARWLGSSLYMYQILICNICILKSLATTSEMSRRVAFC